MMLRRIILFVISIILIGVLSNCAFAQDSVKFAIGKTTDTAVTQGSLKSNGILRLPKYANTDTNKVVSFDAIGRIIFVTKGAGGGGSGTVTSITVGAGLNGGTITTSGTISMPNVGTPGSFGDTITVPVITTDAQGRVVNIALTTIRIPWNNVMLSGNTTSSDMYILKRMGTPHNKGSGYIGFMGADNDLAGLFAITDTNNIAKISGFTGGGFAGSRGSLPGRADLKIGSNGDYVDAVADSNGWARITMKGRNSSFIRIDSGNIYILQESGFVDTIDVSTLTGGQHVHFPNKSGTIALTSDIGTGVLSVSGSTGGGATISSTGGTNPVIGFTPGFTHGLAGYGLSFPAGTPTLLMADASTVEATLGFTPLSEDDTAAMLDPYLLKAVAAATYQPIGSYVPTTRTLTINGTALDLSANRAWSVGTVTSVVAGTGLSGGTITGTGTISMPSIGTANTYAYPSSMTTDAQGRVSSVTAGSAPTGGTVTSITYTAPLTGGTVTTSGTVAIPASTNSVDGYLTAVDHTSFAAKQAAGNYITALTGDGAASGPGSAAFTLSTVNATPGAYTNSTVTVDGKGRVTSAASGATPVTSIAGTTGNITATGTTAVTVNLATAGTAGTNGTSTQIPVFVTDAFGRVTSSTNTAIGTLNQNTTGTASNVTGIVLPVNGGTGIANNNTATVTSSGNFTYTRTLTGNTNITFPTSGTIYGTASSSITSSQLITSVADETGSGSLVFSTTPTVSTPVINGLATGTGVSASGTSASTLKASDANANLSANNVLVGVTSVATAAGTTTLTIGSAQSYLFTGSTTQTVLLPLTSSTTKGAIYYLTTGPSTGVVTVQANGGTTLVAMAPNSSASFVDFGTAGASTDWQTNYQVNVSGNNLTPFHLIGGSSIPTIAAGTGAGTSPTVSMGTGSTDLSGYINVTTGTLPALSGTVATITFNVAYGAAPHVTLTPANSNASLLSGATMVFIDQSTGVTTTTFIIKAGTTALVAATAYQWWYTISQ